MMNSMIWSTILMLLPVLWAQVGPTVTTMITAYINQVVGGYVPRPVQLILSSIITAVAAGLTAAGVGAEGVSAVGMGAVTGMLGLGMQAHASVDPATLLATAPSVIVVKK